MLSDSFPVVADSDARVLILGTLPGPMSLQRGEYYAKPQNAFWRIMGRLADAGPELPYAERLQRLRLRRIALWDVCKTAFRAGALDSAIQPASIVPHDFAGFFAAHPDVALICFNGMKAAQIYRRSILPGLPPKSQLIRQVNLPSTSPALAALSFDDKLRRWSEALKGTTE